MNDTLTITSDESLMLEALAGLRYARWRADDAFPFGVVDPAIENLLVRVGDLIHTYAPTMVLVCDRCGLGPYHGIHLVEVD